MQDLETVRVVATDVASQGPFVVMNKADFNPAVHKLYAEDIPVEVKPRRGRPPKITQGADNGDR